MIQPGDASRARHAAGEWFRAATEPAIVRRSIATAAVVGTILAAINHGPSMVRGALTGEMWAQVALTYLVPFLVATAASASAIGRQRRAGLAEKGLLVRDVAGALNFPEENPNPVLRLSVGGAVLYANRSSAPVARAIGAVVGKSLRPDVMAEVLAAARSEPRRSFEVSDGRRTFAVLPVLVPEFEVVNLYGTEITANKVVERFPDRNPNPVLRMDGSGALIYANASSSPIVEGLGLKLGDHLPDAIRAAVDASLDRPANDPIEVQGAGRTFALRPVPIPEFEFTNLYGTDITANKALDKFPDQNPNPVLRVSQEGRLVYANPASSYCRHALGIEVGDLLPAAFLVQVRSAVDSGSRDNLELQHDGRIFELVVVSVYEFGFINLYGTDVTAARQIHQAHRENERLLLNILPVSIADRLRHGETVIADRFDEMTVLFADVVGFTEWSARMPATEVVETLNGIFSIFDGLSDRYGLEKIKTIGDSYMVVGGLTEDGGHQAERVAAMGLDMIGEIARFRTASGAQLQIRVGMHVGPAVAGVIGIRKFIYDVWGDTVNTASRMEANGLPDQMQVSETTFVRLREAFELEPRGIIDVKGKGPMSTWFVADRRAEIRPTWPSGAAPGAGAS